MINPEDSDDLKGLGFSWTGGPETATNATASLGTLGIAVNGSSSPIAISFRFAETQDYVDDLNSFNMNVSRSSYASGRGGDGSLQFFDNNVPRIVYNDDVVCMGLMLERSSFNDILYSTYPIKGDSWVLDDADYGWVYTNASSTDCTGPDNDSNFLGQLDGFVGDALLSTATGSYTTLMMTSPAPSFGEDCILSAFVVSLTGESFDFTIDGGETWTQFGETPAGNWGTNGWYRVNLGVVPAGPYQIGFRYMPSAVDAHFGVYGVQLEPGYSITSYIRSGESPWTKSGRESDIVLLDVSSASISMNSITFLVEGHIIGDSYGGYNDGLIGFDDYNYVSKFTVKDYAGDGEIVGEGDHSLGTFIPNKSYNGFSVAYSALSSVDGVSVVANAAFGGSQYYSQIISGSATGNLTYIQNLDYGLNPGSIILRKLQVIKGASSIPTLLALSSSSF